MESKELRRVYNLLTNEITKAQHKIDRIDINIENSDRLSAEYWCDVRVETVAYLNGIHKAADIVWKELQVM